VQLLMHMTGRGRKFAIVALHIDTAREGCVISAARVFIGWATFRQACCSTHQHLSTVLFSLNTYLFEVWCTLCSPPVPRYSWRLPYAQRIHLPAHHLDCGARRAHLHAAVASGLSGPGAASVAREALKFQEMWDGLEGLRRGRGGTGVA
jgi:hypothetical protein